MGKQQPKPVITRIKAVRRSAPHQWWIDNRRIAKPLLIASGVVAVIFWLIYELIRIASGA